MTLHLVTDRKTGAQVVLDSTVSKIPKTTKTTRLVEELTQDELDERFDPIAIAEELDREDTTHGSRG